LNLRRRATRKCRDSSSPYIPFGHLRGFALPD